MHFYDHELVGAEIANQICRRLAFSNEDREWIREAIQHHMRLLHINQGITDRALRRIANKLERVTLEDLLKIRIADKLGSGVRSNEVEPEQIEKTRKKTEELRTSRAAVKTSGLAINGHDLITALNIRPGPQIGFILNSLLETVLDDPSINTKAQLLELAKEIHAASQEQIIQPSPAKPTNRKIRI